jgi:hypothetical protein
MNTIMAHVPIFGKKNIFARGTGQGAQVLNSGSVLPVVLKMQQLCGERYQARNSAVVSVG